MPDHPFRLQRFALGLRATRHLTADRVIVARDRQQSERLGLSGEIGWSESEPTDVQIETCAEIAPAEDDLEPGPVARSRSRRTCIGVAAVTLCFVTREYGGPEEGGWRWDRCQPIRVWIGPRRRAERLQRRLERLCDRLNQGRPPLHSVLSDGCYEVLPGEVEPTPTPVWS